MKPLDRFAEQICDEMIANLRHNVGEQEKRLHSALSSAVEHRPHKTGCLGSNPRTRTKMPS